VKGESPGEGEAQESHALFGALIRHQGVADSQSAEGLEAGLRRRANGQKACGPERVSGLVAGKKL
jgi:hypothetical protein